MAIERPPSAAQDPMTFFHDMDALRTDDPALAEPMERALARVIDLLIAMVLYVAVTLTVYAMITDPPPVSNVGPDNVVTGERADGTATEFPRQPRNLRESWISATIGMACALGFLAAMEVTTGRSLGKRALKLRIVQAEGFESPSPGQAWLRFAAFSLPLLLIFAAWNGAPNGGLRLAAFFGIFVVIFLLDGRVFFDNDRRAWHDRVAKTRVVVNRHGR